MLVLMDKKQCERITIMTSLGIAFLCSNAYEKGSLE
jgi:hypothetical protein